MGTVAEQILGRLNALEAQVANMQLTGGIDDSTPIPPTESMRGVHDILSQLRDRITQLENVGIGGPTSSETQQQGNRQPFMSPKDLLPDILDKDFKDRWRLWSYKARDYLAL